MSHRAAVYTVRVRRKRDRSRAFRPLGDIDGQGSGLLSAFGRYMSEFESKTADGTKILRGVDSRIEGDELLIMTQNGQNGVTADLIDQSGSLIVHRTAKDTELLRCACLVRLPPAEQTGWLAAHVNNGRGIKGLPQKELARRFLEEYPDLVLDITPYVIASALRAAIEEDRIDQVKLVKWEQPNDRANAATDKWVDAGVGGRLELKITARGRAEHVLTRLLRQFVVDEDHSVFGEIVEFEGMTFDEARVEVEQDGAKRTYNIEKPTAGHPVTQIMSGLTFLDDGEPEEASLFDALRLALSTVGS
jgi:hypothetical protein